jgi:hypothetical protein
MKEPQVWQVDMKVYASISSSELPVFFDENKILRQTNPANSPERINDQILPAGYHKLEYHGDEEGLELFLDWAWAHADLKVIGTHKLKTKLPQV